MISLIIVIPVCINYVNCQQWNLSDRSERQVFPTQRIHISYATFLLGCHTAVTAVTLSFCCTPYHWELLSFLLLFFFYFSLFHLSFFPPSLFLFVSWLTEWVSRRLCCVVFDSSLGAKLSLMQLLGPTVFLKSVSINIIMAYSLRHWIFYCNVQQNITPTLNTTQRKSYCLTETFYFDWKVFVRSVSSVEVFVFLLCFPFCALGKVRGPCLIKWLRVFFFLSGIYYWHFPGIGLGALRVGVLYLILQLSSQENHVVQSCRLISLVQHPHRIWLWLE